jgi:hypothetical protein
MYKRTYMNERWYTMPKYPTRVFLPETGVGVASPLKKIKGLEHCSIRTYMRQHKNADGEYKRRYNVYLIDNENDTFTPLYDWDVMWRSQTPDVIKNLILQQEEELKVSKTGKVKGSLTSKKIKTMQNNLEEYLS